MFHPISCRPVQVVLDDSKVDAFLADCTKQYEAILDAVRSLISLRTLTACIPAITPADFNSESAA